MSFASAKNKAEIKGKQIIILHDCRLAVMKVAVLFQFNSWAIAARVLRSSYGSVIYKFFDLDKHSYKRRYFDKEGTSRCKKAFDELIAKDTRVPFTGKK